MAKIRKSLELQRQMNPLFEDVSILVRAFVEATGYPHNAFIVIFLNGILNLISLYDGNIENRNHNETYLPGVVRTGNTGNVWRKPVPEQGSSVHRSVRSRIRQQTFPHLQSIARFVSDQISNEIGQ